MPRTYDAKFRHRVLELERAGRPVRVVAAELGLAEAKVYRWKAQDLVDRERWTGGLCGGVLQPALNAQTK